MSRSSAASLVWWFALVGCTSGSPPAAESEGGARPVVESKAAVAAEPDDEAEPDEQFEPLDLPTLEVSSEFELHACGEVAELTEFGGRVYGVTRDGRSACAFDLANDGQGLRVDRLRSDDELAYADAAQLVRRRGDVVSQTIAVTWPSTERRLGVFERTPSGIELVSEASSSGNTAGTIRLTAGPSGEPLVAYTARSVTLGCSRDPGSVSDSQYLWNPLGPDQEPQYLDDGVVHQVAYGSGTLVVGRVLDNVGPLDSLPSACDERVLAQGFPLSRETGRVDRTTRWRSRLAALPRSVASPEILDMLVLDGQVLVLGHCDGFAWASSLSPDDGHVTWATSVGAASIGRLVPVGAAVEAVLYIHLRGDRHMLGRHRIDANGTVVAIDEFELDHDSGAQVRALAADERRVWLGGRIEHAWLGIVESR
jgi:hypothetical protein